MRSLALLRSLLAASLLAACTPGAQSPAPPATSTLATLALLAHDAEVWSWTLELRGQLQGPGELRACTFYVDEQAHPASVAAREFSARVPLPEGTHAIVARCSDTRGKPLRTQAVRFTQRLEALPIARAALTVVGDTLQLDGSASEPSAGSRAPLVSYTWRRVEQRRALEPSVGQGTRVELALPKQPGPYQYELLVRDERGRAGQSRVALDVAADGSASVRSEASWIDDAVVYGIVPPLYDAQRPFAGVTAALEGLRELGVTTLWLSPMFATPADDYGYAVTDYFAVREDFGGERAFKTLVETAHERGLRVLLDLVINHSSAQHPYFREAELLGARSHYFDFFARDAAGKATHYFDWAHLPNLNYENPEVQSWSHAFSLAWLRDYAIDGYRVDAAWGVRERAPTFYPAWSAALRSHDPDVLLLAEASARDPYYVTHGYDAAYDWTAELGHHAWEHVFSDQPGIAQRLASAVEETQRATPRPERTLRFLNNNDTGKRFITRHGEALTRVATAALLTLPGIPCLFTLDEVGAEYEPYEEAPAVVSDRPGLRDFHRTLIALRRATPALHGPGYQQLRGDAQSELFAFVRTGSATSAVAVVALNFGAQPLSLSLSLPPPVAKALGPHARDALSETVQPVRAGRLALELAPWSARVFVPEKSAPRR